MEKHESPEEKQVKDAERRLALWGTRASEGQATASRRDEACGLRQARGALSCREGCRDQSGPPPTWILKRSAREGTTGSCRLSCGLLPASPGGSSRSADRPVQESFWLSGDDVCENRSWHCGGESSESVGRPARPQAAGPQAAVSGSSPRGDQ